MGFNSSKKVLFLLAKVVCSPFLSRSLIALRSFSEMIAGPPAFERFLDSFLRSIGGSFDRKFEVGIQNTVKWFTDNKSWINL